MKKIPTIFLRDTKLKCTPVTDEHNPECDWVFRGEGIAYRKLDGINVLIKHGEYFGGKQQFAYVRVKPDDKDYDEAPYERANPDDKVHRLIISIASRCILQAGVYEVIGEGIRGNPEKMPEGRGCVAVPVFMPVDPALKLYDEPKRTYRDLMGYFATHDIEGIVYHHDDGRMAKIKTKDFYHLKRP